MFEELSDGLGDLKSMSRLKRYQEGQIDILSGIGKSVYEF